MQYFDIKKSLPVFCSLLITACSGGGGGGSNNSNHQAHPVNQVPAPVLHVAAKPQQHVEEIQAEEKVVELEPLVNVAQPIESSNLSLTESPKKPADNKISKQWEGESIAKWRKTDFNYSKDAVFTRHLVENPKAIYDTDPNLISKEIQYIKLQLGDNVDNVDAPNYELNLLNENAYYGFYRDSQDMNHVENIYVYGFKKDAENHENLQSLTANYEGEFLFSTATNLNVTVTGRVVLKYQEGKAKGEILERDIDYKLFDISVDKKPNQAILNPVVEALPGSNIKLVNHPNSPDRITVDLHFIKGQDNQENKYIVGQGGNEKYWGVLGLEKKETKAEK
ncbi:TPA: hypothetical protein QB360_002066 [Pasteurella multocida]|uniref:hypothetical protein n=1 Tax=Pasteurella multocida TaxID=747 RepID=UPI0020220D7A|nr:hypothetical protein [Pasteurella multocida]MCL7816857.1 hypothetical protein [Pasteurella multocida]HDR1027164.1 hypothetical protein [Pasteurella multocida]HDR1497393.1 hypothetical protein [Pasteurella multocida]